MNPVNYKEFTLGLATNFSQRDRDRERERERETETETETEN